jgi:HlyD family secretion protein
MSSVMDRQIQRPKWRGKRAMIAAGGTVSAAAVIAVAAMALLGGSARSIRVPLATVTLDQVERGVFHDITPLRGKIAPHDIVYLDALEGGQVEKVLVHAGDEVTVGQPLLAFRNTQLELDVLDREGRLIESITQLQAYEKQLEDARLANEKARSQIEYDIVRLGRTAQRTEALAAKGYAPIRDLQQVHDELGYNQRLHPLQLESNAKQDLLRQRQLPQIHAELESLRQSLKITRAKLDDLVVKAPIAGKLTDVVRNIGENRNRGERLGEIVPDTGFKIAANVDEFYLGRVRPGQIADANINGRTWKLRVDRVYPEVKDGTFTVDLDFASARPQGLSPGQAVDGTLPLGGDRAGLVLPAGAFLERTGGDWVMVLAPGGHHAVRRRIKIGRRNAELVEVLSGLKAGERVITSDYAAFEKVDRVNLSN